MEAQLSSSQAFQPPQAQELTFGSLLRPKKSAVRCGSKEGRLLNSRRSQVESRCPCFDSQALRMLWPLA